MQYIDFDHGENLSFDHCGKVEKGTRQLPWGVAIARSDGATCFGVFISKYHFITCKVSSTNNALFILI
jgi:hypothetical protein